MRVLILGGTGAMGMHLTKLLSDSGIDNVVTSRIYRVPEGRTCYIQGNARDVDFIRTILQEHWDVIVDFMIYSTSDFGNRVNRLLDATSQYVFLSSARVYAGTTALIAETSPRLLDASLDEEFLKTEEYSLIKARQEDILKLSGRSNWTVIRPYITYSESRLQLGTLEKEEWLYRALHGRTILFSDDINSKVTTMTYGLDVARGIASVLGNSHALGETFHITTENPSRWSDILAVYLSVLEKHLGKKPKVLFQNLDDFTRYRPGGKHQVIYDRLFDRQFDNSKISEYVDTANFVKTDVGLKRCLECFLESPKFKNIDWVAEALKDRQTKEHTPLREIKGISQKLKYLTARYCWTWYCLSLRGYGIFRRSCKVFRKFSKAIKKERQ